MQRRQFLQTALSATVLVPAPGVPAAKRTPQFWYEDNNLRSAGGVPQDFFARYDTPDRWARALEAMDVFYLRQNTFERHLAGNETALRKMAVVHNTHGISLAYDCVGATWAHFKHDFRAPDYSHTLRQVDALIRLGHRVTHIGLQSILSKPTPNRSDYAMSWRIQDAAVFARQLKTAFPEIRLGVIDALPSKGLEYRTPYADLKAALEAEGQVLGFLDLDMPMSHPREGIKGNSWKSMAAVGDYVRGKLRTEFGLICTDNVGGFASSVRFRHLVLDGLGQFLSVGGSADHYVLMSWYPFPDQSVPDTAPESPTQCSVFLDMVRKVRPS